MDSQYEPDPIPPNLSDYLGPDGNLHMSISRDSVLYKLTHVIRQVESSSTCLWLYLRMKLMRWCSATALSRGSCPHC